MEDFFKGLCDSLAEYMVLAGIIAVTFLMAVFRTAKEHGKVDWVEAIMCGLFSLGIWFVLGWFNIPEGGGVLIGGIIGYKGSAAVSEWLSDKFGFDDDKDEENK